MGIVLGALDIGTQTTTLVTGECVDGRLSLLARAETPTQGVKKGIIRDITAVADGIRRVREEMDKKLRVEIYDVVAGFSCGDVTTLVRPGRVSLLPGHLINEEDVADAEDNARAPEDPDAPNRLLQRFRQKYEVNGQPVATPLGMTGAELVANILELTAPRTCLDSLTSAVARAGLRLDEIVFSGIAAAEAVLDDRARDDGAVVIDFGAGTVDYVAICNGVVAAAGALGVGGNHLTNDLALAFHITQGQAEDTKLARGAAMLQPDLANARHTLRTPFSAGDRTISVHAIQTVTTERVDETFRILRDRLRESDVLPHVHGGIRLTGGTAALPLIAEQASSVFGLPCAIGVPGRNLATPLADPFIEEPYRHATAIGLLNWRCRTLAREPRKPSWLARLRAYIAG